MSNISRALYTYNLCHSLDMVAEVIRDLDSNITHGRLLRLGSLVGMDLDRVLRQAAHETNITHESFHGMLVRVAVAKAENCWPDDIEAQVDLIAGTDQ